jgi:polyhydroxyalkanoate synthase
MSATAPRAASERESVAERIRLEVERAIARNIKGVEYIASPAPAMGPTPKDLVHKEGTLNLFHYHPIASEIYRVPVLIVMATTNKGYVLDLARGQSLVEFLLTSGYDVYMIDWSPPRPDEKKLRLADYVLRFIPDCVRLIKDRSGQDEVSVLGYCMGGVLSAIYTAAHPDDGVKNLVCFTTPIDFSKMTLFQKWADRRFFDVDTLVDSTGNVPSEMLFQGFQMLRPASQTAGQVQLWDNLWNEEYVKSFRMFDRWGADMLPLAGEYFRDTTKKLMWDNGLYNGTLEVGGRRITLAAITVPMLHVIAEHDHIVPRDASKPFIELVGSEDKEEIVLKGGHISVAAGANASKRMWPKLDAWLGTRSV